MKKSSRGNFIFPATCLAALLLSAFSFSCEPENWDLIMARPEPPSELTVTEITEETDLISITLQFRVPEFAITTLFPYRKADAIFYFRPEGASEEDTMYIPDSWAAGNIGEFSGTGTLGVGIAKTSL